MISCIDPSPSEIGRLICINPDFTILGIFWFFLLTLKDADFYDFIMLNINYLTRLSK